jgi:TM2 domain-containing membrane protein YozV
MSDETSRTEGWSATDASAGVTPEDRVGFCQDCGKPLTQATVRTVGTGVFCEPCLAARVGATAPASGYTTVPPYAAAPSPSTLNAPSPLLAAILGFIPGVGAMYNGQFAKGIVHLAVFALLVSLSDNVNGIFGVFVVGWVFYMAFEAYHTAVARRDGLPLPNAFNLNDIGERMGFGKSWANTSPTTPVPPAGAPPAGTSPAGNPYTVSTSVPVNPVPVGTAPDWVGYVPPTAFASANYRSQATPNAGMPHTPYSHAPYGETYTGVSAVSGDLAAGAPATLPARRFPTGAIWLIGLGALILAANLLPDWKVTERWWPPLLFTGLGIWALTRRLHSGARLVDVIRWPILLLILAFMLALHAAGVLVTFGLICSVLLIAFGALLLVERLAGPSSIYRGTPATGPYEGTPVPVTPAADAARSRVAWETPQADTIISKPDPRDGQ